MPTVPLTPKLSASSEDILNAIRNSASANYRDYIPEASASQNNIREIGAIIMNYPALQNEFLNALVNRIGRVIVTSKMYSNPWAKFKRGIMEYGETIEEIFVNIAKPFEFDPAVAEEKVFAREIPDVRAAFHPLNYQKYYKTTISQDQLRQAFLSWQGILDLIAKIVDSMYTAANYDEFNVMKYLIGRNIINGRLTPIQIAGVSSANMKSIVGTIKGTSNAFEFMSSKYNVAGVQNYSLKDSQYIIVNAEFDAVMDVEVLASAFNMDKADFMGHRVLVDSFGELDTTRLAQLFANSENYTAFTEAEITALKAVPAVIVDEDWFMIYDNLNEFTEQYNGQGLYWNYWYHVWKTFSVSPFANSAVFVPGAPAVTAISLSPEEAVIMPGQSVLLTATVSANYFASKAVIYSAAISGMTDDEVAEVVTISPLGIVTVSPDIEAGTEITVTATSAVNSGVTDTATITVYSAD